MRYTGARDTGALRYRDTSNYQQPINQRVRVVRAIPVLCNATSGEKEMGRSVRLNLCQGEMK